MRRNWTAIVLAIVLASAIGGCAPAPTSPPRPRVVTPPVTPSAAPTLPVDTKTKVPLTPAPAATFPLRVYFELAEKVQSVQRIAGTKAVLRASLDALVKGPTSAEKRAGLGTQIPAGTRVRGVTISSGVATVDLTHEFASGGGTASMTGRLAQVVYTATQFSGVDAVTFKIDGTAIDVFGGEGIVIDRPQTRADMEYATPAILVDTPAWGGTVSGPFVARGTADVFEGDFQFRLLGAGSKVLFEQHVKASSGTGTRGSWSVSPDVRLPNGPARLRVFALSAKDGSPENVVEIPIVIRR